MATTNNSDLREVLAALCHEQWSGWMEYLFSKCTSPSGEVFFDADVGETCSREALIPHSVVSRWFRQMTTTYNKLGEEEKESDRKEADKIIGLLKSKDVLRPKATYTLSVHPAGCACMPILTKEVK